MATKQQLKRRWEQEPGRAIQQSLEKLFFDLNVPGYQGSKDIEPLLKGLPFSEEVPGGRDLRGITLQGGVGNLDLKNYDFSHAKLEFNLINCDLTGARFDEATVGGVVSNKLVGASFQNAKLRSCSFSDSDLKNCCFDNAMLGGASFDRSDLAGASFRAAKCKGASFVSANLHGCDFQMAILDEAVFLNVHLDKSTNLRGASLVNLYNKDQRDTSGRLVQPGTDWQLATYDASTTYRKDPAAQALELLEELGNLLTGDNSRQAKRLQ
ncbi:pentapeptide repeat-containing protein [Archangium sp.]|uniref:pentapeptide repeat-containing protein n=1 Tax=Archangium sp. TaxID=1872627 RepID=UPI002D6ACD2A|nr:pentapeptide repeat-containing protein [Archangium sp.]HYO52374.1 pentapeptide repeat-containing protein [Archangium sp.]